MLWAFMTANYVGRALGYANNTDWMANHRATVETFHGPQFGTRFAELIDDITAAGFDAIELWVAHLDPLLATPEMIATANQILRERDVKLISYTAGFGQPGVSREDATRIFETAKAIGAPVFAQGFHPANGPIVAELGQRYGIRMGLENHPHKTAQEVIDIVAPFAPWVGSANDTGWFATQGYDAVRATYELRDYLVHMHLKDITAVGGHETCALGDGVVDIPGVLKALKEIGYTGAVSIEHEPYDHDPTEACALSLKRAAAWWAEIEGGSGMIDPTPALAYLDATQALLERIRATQLESIAAAAAICAESIAAGGLVHLFGTGHSRIPVEEIFPRHGSFPGFHPIVELSLTYHTQVIGANGQRQAMFLERIEGFGEVILRNFVFGPHDSCMVFSNGGVNEVVIDVALGAKRRGMPVIAVVSRAHCAASPARHSSGRRLPDIADVTVDNCAPVGDALVTVAGLEYPVGPASTVGYAIVVNMLKCLVAAELTRRGQPPLVLTSGALIGSQASAELFDRTYDDYRARVAQVYGQRTNDE